MNERRGKPGLYNDDPLKWGQNTSGKAGAHDMLVIIFFDTLFLMREKRISWRTQN
jgi:hypothetical protein